MKNKKKNKRNTEPTICLKHTEGPWLTTQLPGVQQANAIIDDYENELIAFIIPRGHYTHSDGNARLIAAAPELLDSLMLTLKALKNLKSQLPKAVRKELDLKLFYIAEKDAQTLINKFVSYED